MSEAVVRDGVLVVSEEWAKRWRELVALESESDDAGAGVREGGTPAASGDGCSR